MPLFGYICRGCGAQSEMLVRADEKVLCPECGSSKVERQMGRFAPVMGKSAEPACSSCAMANEGCCASHQHGGCMS